MGHPMCIGALLMLSGVPLALGSWWGLLTFIPITFVIVWRLLNEEDFLAKNLPAIQSTETRSNIAWHGSFGSGRDMRGNDHSHTGFKTRDGILAVSHLAHVDCVPGSDLYQRA